MTLKNKKVSYKGYRKPIVEIPKPKLLHIGEHFISPDDIAGIKKASREKDLYILILKSQPNPEWPIWLKGKDVNSLLESFEIITSD